MEHKPHSPTNLAEATSSLAKDPVCGMSVDPATARHKAEHDGETFFFCSAGCREKFVADPARFLAAPAHAPASPRHDHADHASAAASPKPAPPGAIYTCPMHPEIRQDHPGACPICGMALEPETPAEATGPSAELVDMTRRFWVALGAFHSRLRARNGRASGRSAPVRCPKGSPTGFSWRSRLRSRSGRAGRSSSAAGRRSRAATSTCSR